MWLKTKAIFLILALAVLPSGAFASRKEPVYNVVDHPIPAWVHQLEKNIDDQLTVAGTAAR